MPTNKFCKDCEWSKFEPREATLPSRYVCNRPDPDLVTGEQQSNGSCYEQRKYSIEAYKPEIQPLMCGREGKFYKDKSIPRG